MLLTIPMIEELLFKNASMAECVLNDIYLSDPDTEERRKFEHELRTLALEKELRIIIRQNPITNAYHITWFPEAVRIIIWQ